MEEMNGVAHYVLGRALSVDAARAQTCALWTRARDALTASYDYLAKVPRVTEADGADARLSKQARAMVLAADSARARSCQPAAA